MRAVPSVTQFVGLSTSLWTHYMVIWLYLMVLTSDYTCFARSSALSEHNKFNAIQEIGDEDSHISYGDNNNDNRDSFHTSSSVQTSSESSTNNILLDFGVIPLIGVTSKQDLLAVSTTDTITVFQLSHDSVALKNVSLRNAFNSQQLYRIQLKPPCDFDLVEFKFLNQSSIFICDAVLCRLCFLGAEQNCVIYSLKTKHRSNDYLLQLSATITSDDAIALRYVNANGEAAILKYDILTNTSQKPISPSQYANDISIINNQRTVTAFNRNGFSYFVGSANRPYEPLINSKINEEAELTSVQLTRICDRDATENLESRIDLALGCPHIALNGNALASAAEYDEVSDRLTVVFHSLTTAHGHDSLSSSESSDSICTYNMADINQKFEKIWNDCQNTTISASQDDCYSALDVKSLPNHCFIFTRLADGHAMTPCSRFGGNHQSPRAQNCDLHKLTSLAYRYGWLEEFNPFSGTLFAMLPSDSAEILSLGHVQGDNAIFTLDANGRLHRIGHDLPTKTNTHLWSRYLLSQWRRFAFVADSKRNKIYYIENNQIKYVEVSCTGLYQNCDALERSKWSDPLGCLWCAKSNESGKTIARTDRCTDISITDICPPYIKHVNLSPESPHSTVVELYGDKFDRLQGMSVSVCNRSCPVKMVEHNRVSCLLSKKFEDTSSCVINAEGELGKHGPFALEYNHTVTQTTIDTASSTHSHRSTSTRTIRAIASVIAVLFLVILIALIILLVRRYQARQRLRRKQADAASLQIPFDTMNGSITGHSSSADCNAYIGHNGNGYLPRRFNPYEQLFSEIDPKLKVPLNDLIIGDEIGKGNFGVVYRATLCDCMGEKREVACKTIDSHADGVVSGVSEFLREGLIMANFKHPNVAQLVGISLTKNNCPLIITDYLANGDLRHYITNQNNRLTFGKLLDFGIQIAKGMDYLHQKQFIHRDLAARNCMLDANLVVKISDFGLSRDVSRCGMYKAVTKDRGIPIRWMPIESLEDQQYTFKGDIWAYGVVLWELATRGLIPYANLEMHEILRLLKAGHRLSKPKGCPDLLYDNVMLVCWNEDPNRRPTFHELIDMMQDVVSQLRNGAPGNSLLTNHYERVSPRSAATTPIAYPKPIAAPVTTAL